MSTKNVSFRAPTEKISKLDALAEITGHDRSFYLNEAIDQFLDVMNSHTRHIEQGLAEAEAGQLISHDEVIQAIQERRSHRLTPEAFLRNDFKDWPGDWEGDFDYVDGMLQRHDWGDYSHGNMQTRLMCWFADFKLDWHIWVIPSLTLQITPTRFRVPDVAIFNRNVRGESPAVTTAPLIVIEVLSPEDTMMHIAALEADYREMGVANIWIIDPGKERGWRCEREGWFNTEQFAVAGTDITLSLADLPSDD